MRAQISPPGTDAPATMIEDKLALYPG